MAFTQAGSSSIVVCSLLAMQKADSGLFQVEASALCCAGLVAGSIQGMLGEELSEASSGLDSVEAMSALKPYL